MQKRIVQVQKQAYAYAGLAAEYAWQSVSQARYRPTQHGSLL